MLWGVEPVATTSGINTEKERIPDVLGIWIWPVLAAVVVPGPVFLALHPVAPYLEPDSRVQLQKGIRAVLP